MCSCDPSLHLGAERVLVQPYFRRLPWFVVDRYDVEPVGTLRRAALGKKSLRRANHDALLFPGHTKFRQRWRLLSDCARSNFHKGKCIAIVTDQIQFALYASRRVIPRYKNVPVPPQIPIRIGLPAHPVRRASSFFASLEKSSSTRKPRRAAQRTARNIKLEKIGMLPSSAIHIFRAV